MILICYAQQFTESFSNLPGKRLSFSQMIITKHSLAGHSAAIYNAVCLYNINWKMNRN